tara:strand:+ start:62 stop:301 length:240 start_codon:yes stop_codon:yes gene_type:complete
MPFKIKKQLIPEDVAYKILKQLHIKDGSEPDWATRGSVWVEKLDSSDTIYEYPTLMEALKKRDELIKADTTRLYRVVQS